MADRNQELIDIVAETPGVELHGKSLRIDFRFHGKRCRETLNMPATKANIKHASRKREAILHEIAIGVFDYAKHFPDSKNAHRFAGTTASRDISLGDLVEHYLKIKDVDIGDNARGRYRSILGMLASDLDHTRVVSTFRTEDLQQWRRYLMTEPRNRTSKPLAPRSVNYYMMVAAGLFNFAKQNGYTHQDLSSVLTKVEVIRDKPDPFDQDEFRRLQESARHDMDAMWVQLACWTGMRTGELCSLAWEDVDLERGELQIRRNITQARNFKVPKTGHERTIVLLPPAIEALKRMRPMTAMRQSHYIKKTLRDRRQVDEKVTFVFSPDVTSKTPGLSICYTAFTLGDKWDRLIKRAGIRRRTQYHMRHTFACWMLTAGANPEWVASYLGHEDSTMVRTVYGKWIPEQDRDEADRVWGRLGASFSDLAPMKPQDFKATQ